MNKTKDDLKKGCEKTHCFLIFNQRYKHFNLRNLSHLISEPFWSSCYFQFYLTTLFRVFSQKRYIFSIRLSKSNLLHSAWFKKWQSFCWGHKKLPLIHLCVTLWFNLSCQNEEAVIVMKMTFLIFFFNFHLKICEDWKLKMVLNLWKLGDCVTRLYHHCSEQWWWKKRCSKFPSVRFDISFSFDMHLSLVLV